jgi:glutathione peroxidase-family protein
VYSFLKNQPGCGGQIMWNFRTKFLVSKSGVVTRHDGVNTKDLEPEVLKRLDA